MSWKPPAPLPECYSLAVTMPGVGHMRRREFITLLGGSAVPWPLAAHAQQSEQVRRIGVLMPLTADDADEQALMPIFVQAVQQLGWTEGLNLRIDFRGAGANPDDSRK